MNEKKKINLYMAYPMEFKHGFNEGYWKNISDKLKDSGFNVFNPAEKEIDKTGMLAKQVIAKMKAMKQRITFDEDAKKELVKINDKIWKVDLEAIDKSDVLMVYYDINIVSDGSRREIYRMIDKGGIIYLICPHKFEFVSTVVLASVIKDPRNKLFHKVDYAVDSIIKDFGNK